MIALESRLGAQLFGARLGRLFQIQRGDTRLNQPSHQLQHLANHLARAAHLLDLPGRLQYYRQLANQLSTSYAQTRHPAALLARPLNGYNDSGCDFRYRPTSINFRETSQSPVVLNHRRGRGRVSAHALLEDLFRVVGSLDQSGAVRVAYAIPFGRLAVDVINALADRTIPSPRNTAQ